MEIRQSIQILVGSAIFIIKQNQETTLEVRIPPYYNGQYGVQTDKSGYLYMRTRYYSPQFKRFMSADVIDGSIADSTTLNLYAYVNGNPISFVDPFGLSADRGDNNSKFEIGWELNPGQADYIGWGT